MGLGLRTLRNQPLRMLLAESKLGRSLMVTVSSSAKCATLPAAAAAASAGRVSRTASERPRKRKGSPTRSPERGATTRCLHGAKCPAERRARVSPTMTTRATPPSARSAVSSTGTHSPSERRSACSPAAEAHTSRVSKPTSLCSSQSTSVPYAPSRRESYRQSRSSECASRGASAASASASASMKEAEARAAPRMRSASDVTAASSSDASISGTPLHPQAPETSPLSSPPSSPPSSPLSSPRSSLLPLSLGADGAASQSPARKRGSQPSSAATCGSRPRATPSSVRTSRERAAEKRSRPSASTGAGWTAPGVARTSSCSRYFPSR
mmetsp:Transcript_12640/g.41949  ORF Transcript_12640/g.41949 Transcript_12640/m.41949 type:complete len:325 (+) Transcript_12640:244-1218(+)